MIIDGYRLEKTCSVCPEQYDVFLGDLLVGYLRLRHGSFRADYVVERKPETVYQAFPMGVGMFEPDERDHYLGNAIRAIKARHTGLADDMIAWSQSDMREGLDGRKWVGLFNGAFEVGVVFEDGRWIRHGVLAIGHETSMETSPEAAKRAVGRSFSQALDSIGLTPKT